MHSEEEFNQLVEKLPDFKVSEERVVLFYFTNFFSHILFKIEDFQKDYEEEEKSLHRWETTWKADKTAEKVNTNILPQFSCTQCKEEAYHDKKIVRTLIFLPFCLVRLYF